MPEYSDIYIITGKRDSVTVEDFLQHFLPQREESADEYEIPQYSNNPEKVFNKAYELMKHCERNRKVEYSIYWRARGGVKPEHGMVFYLEDGNVIYGLSTDAEDQAYARRLLQEMKSYFNASHGYIGHEASPNVGSYTEFLKQVELHEP